jgi:hypothetical protein
MALSLGGGEPCEELVAQLASRGLETGALGRSFGFNLSAGGLSFELVFAGEARDEGFLLVGLRTSQFVVEVNDREHYAELGTEFEEKAEKGNRVGASGDGHSHALAGMEEFAAADVVEEFVRQGMHGNMVQPVRTGGCLDDLGRSESGICHQIGYHRNRLPSFRVFQRLSEHGIGEEGLISQARPLIVANSPPIVADRYAVLLRHLLPSYHDVFPRFVEAPVLFCSPLFEKFSQTLFTRRARTFQREETYSKPS